MVVPCQFIGGPLDGQTIPIPDGWAFVGVTYDEAVGAFAATFSELATEGYYCPQRSPGGFLFVSSEGYAVAKWPLKTQRSPS
jgi:hypothetical protein